MDVEKDYRGRPGFLTTDTVSFNSVAALRRFPRSHKGDYGKVCVIAGSKNMAGAAYLSSKAAYLCGAGLVKIVTPECNRVILQTLLPEAVLETYDEDAGENEILSCARSCTTAVLGPGLGKSEQAKRIVYAALESLSLPLVLDADGINACAHDPSVIANYRGRLILTPHFGEASRLTGIPAAEISRNPPAALDRLLALCGHAVLLKDARTLISDGKSVFCNLSGCDALAKGGSGDVLSGILGAFVRDCADDRAFLDACAAGAHLHGLCGEYAAKKHGKHSVLASHVIDEIENVLRVLL